MPTGHLRLGHRVGVVHPVPATTLPKREPRLSHCVRAVPGRHHCAGHWCDGVRRVRSRHVRDQQPAELHRSSHRRVRECQVCVKPMWMHSPIYNLVVSLGCVPCGLPVLLAPHSGCLFCGSGLDRYFECAPGTYQPSAGAALYVKHLFPRSCEPTTHGRPPDRRACNCDGSIAALCPGACHARSDGTRT